MALLGCLWRRRAMASPHRRRCGDRARVGGQYPCPHPSFGVAGISRRSRWGAAVIPVPSGERVLLAVGRTDMRKGMNGLALQVQKSGCSAIRVLAIFLFFAANAVI